jgi:hypothetical protein
VAAGAAGAVGEAEAQDAVPRADGRVHALVGGGAGGEGADAAGGCGVGVPEMEGGWGDDGVSKGGRCVSWVVGFHVWRGGGGARGTNSLLVSAILE